jgi:hypothetical protein
VPVSDCGRDPARCPVCGDANACGVAAGSSDCWCFGAAIPDAALAAVPPEARGEACICRACATREPEAQSRIDQARDLVRLRR